MTIEQLKIRREEVRAQLALLHHEDSELSRQIVAIECPFYIDDIVEFGYTDNRRLAKVTGIACAYGAWELVAQNIKKDGSLGAEIRIGSGHLPKKMVT
jgi:hypothetical protein